MPECCDEHITVEILYDTFGFPYCPTCCDELDEDINIGTWWNQMFDEE